jgi:hypothetical protein
MRLGDRFRRRVRGFRRRLTIELVRVEEPPPSPPPVEPLPLPAPERPRRPSVGLAALYGGQTLDPSPYATGNRPRPLGRGPAHDKALYRDQVSAWRYGTPDPPPPSLDLAQIREELYAPRTYWWEEREH